MSQAESVATIDDTTLSPTPDNDHTQDPEEQQSQEHEKSSCTLGKRRVSSSPLPPSNDPDDDEGHLRCDQARQKLDEELAEQEIAKLNADLNPQQISSFFDDDNLLGTAPPPESAHDAVEVTTSEQAPGSPSPGKGKAPAPLTPEQRINIERNHQRALQKLTHRRAAAILEEDQKAFLTLTAKKEEAERLSNQEIFRLEGSTNRSLSAQETKRIRDDAYHNITLTPAEGKYSRRKRLLTEDEALKIAKEQQHIHDIEHQLSHRPK